MLENRKKLEKAAEYFKNLKENQRVKGEMVRVLGYAFSIVLSGSIDVYDDMLNDALENIDNSKRGMKTYLNGAKEMIVDFTLNKRNKFDTEHLNDASQMLFILSNYIKKKENERKK